MPYADWAYCLLFAETIQALHNGAYTRFIAIYLHREGLLSYRRFYDGLLGFLLSDTKGGGRTVPALAKTHRRLPCGPGHAPGEPDSHPTGYAGPAAALSSHPQRLAIVDLAVA